MLCNDLVLFREHSILVNIGKTSYFGNTVFFERKYDLETCAKGLKERYTMI